MTDDEIRVHPAAAVFPMLADDELADLAADIKANGLLHPIVLDADGVLIDGRNRLAACKLAGVEPTYTTLNGHDPIAFIIGQNVNRRHLTEGQRAIAVVRALMCKLHISEIDQTSVARDGNIERSRVNRAVVIVEHAPELADAVMARTAPFSAAYEQARAIRDAKSDREKTAEKERAQLERVTTADGDLHLMVTEGRLTLADAIAVLDRREREEHDRRRRQVGYMVEATMALRSLLDRPADVILEEWVDDVNPHQKTGPFVDAIWTTEGLRDMAARLDGLAHEMEQRRRGIRGSA